MSITVAEEGLNSCSGCEIAILNLGESLLDLLEELHFVHMPVLMDHKYYGQTGDKDHLSIPEAVLGIVSGSVRNEEHLEVAREMRRKCKVITALGTCATHGGIPALMNQFSNEELFERYYRKTETTDFAGEPDEVVPPFLDRTYALDEVIHVDIYLPGCPPHPDLIALTIAALLQGDIPALPEKSVCDTCPVRRDRRGVVGQAVRFTRNARYDADSPIAEMRCLLDQGFLCMGPVTRAGCSGLKGDLPNCISARVPCRGCFGPVKQTGNQLLDILNALASNGIDIRSIPDRPSLLRFSGSHGRLTKRKVKPAS